MWIRFLLAAVFGGGAVPLFILIAFDGDFKLGNWLDAGFIVGMILFSFGLIATTNAGKLFRGFGFVVKKLLAGKYAHYSYYDYVMEKGESRDKTTGIPLLVVGTIILATASILSYVYLDQYF